VSHDESTERWLDDDYWRVYTGILGLCSYQTTAKIKADFRRQHERLVDKFQDRLERLEERLERIK